MTELNIIEQGEIYRDVARLRDRVRILEDLLSGRPITTARIKDLAVTNAKIVSITVDKLTAGDIVVAVDVGNPATGFTRLNGVNARIEVHDGTTYRGVWGDV